MKHIGSQFGVALAILVCIIAASEVRSQTSNEPSRKYIRTWVAANDRQIDIANLKPDDLELSFAGKRIHSFTLEGPAGSTSICFVIDTSRSMAGVIDKDISKINAIAAGIRQFLMLMGSQREVAAISFDGQVYILTEFVEDGALFNGILESFERFRIPTRDGTKPSEAMSVGLEALSKRPTERKVIILLSDLSKDYSRSSVTKIRNLTKSEPILIYTIAVFGQRDKEVIGLPARGNNNFVQIEGRPPLGTENDGSIINHVTRRAIDEKPLAGRTRAWFHGDQLGDVRLSSQWESLSHSTGGRIYYALSAAEVSEAMELIAEELKDQLLLSIPIEAGGKASFGKISLDLKDRTKRPRDRRALRFRHGSNY